MNKRTLALFGLLLISVAFLFFSLRLAGKKPVTVKGETGVANEEEFWTETAGLLEKYRLAGIPAYYHVINKDPMRPPFASAGAGSAQPFQLMIKGTPYSLTGTMVGPNKSAVIIDEKIYRVGDGIDDKKVVCIEKRRVVLKKGTDEEVLRLTN